MKLLDQGLSIQALSSLGASEELSQETIEGLTTYVIKIYCSKWKETKNRYKDQSDIGQLRVRWDIYSKQRIDGDLLPPTPDALKFKLLRSNFIALVWKRCTWFKLNLKCSESCGCTDCENDSTGFESIDD